MDVAFYFLRKGTRVSIEISAESADKLHNSIMIYNADSFAFRQIPAVFDATTLLASLIHPNH